MLTRKGDRPVVISDAATLQRPRGGIQRFGRPGTFAMILAAMAIIVVACGGGSSDSVENMPSISSGSEVEMAEDLAPNFKFTLFQGQEKLGAGQVDLAQLRGKPVVLNFWAGLCPPCRAEMPDLQAFYDEFGGRVTLVGIDLGQFTGLGSQKDATDLLEDLGITYPAGSTDDASVISQYKIFGMPTTIFIDANGEIFKNWSGALNQDILREQTNAMLSR